MARDCIITNKQLAKYYWEDMPLFDDRRHIYKTIVKNIKDCSLDFYSHYSIHGNFKEYYSSGCKNLSGSKKLNGISEETLKSLEWILKKKIGK